MGITSYLCSKVNSPTSKNKEQLYKLLRYLNTTKDRGIIYKGGGELVPIVYADAAFMVHDDIRSRGAAIVMMCGGPIAAYSSKQTILTRSSTESELVNLDEASILAMVVRRNMIAMMIIKKPKKLF